MESTLCLGMLVGTMQADALNVMTGSTELLLYRYTLRKNLGPNEIKANTCRLIQNQCTMRLTLLTAQTKPVSFAVPRLDLLNRLGKMNLSVSLLQVTAFKTVIVSHY